MCVPFAGPLISDAEVQSQPECGTEIRRCRPRRTKSASWRWSRRRAPETPRPGVYRAAARGEDGDEIRAGPPFTPIVGCRRLMFEAGSHDPASGRSGGRGDPSPAPSHLTRIGPGDLDYPDPATVCGGTHHNVRRTKISMPLLRIRVSLYTRRTAKDGTLPQVWQGPHYAAWQVLQPSDEVFCCHPCWSTPEELDKTTRKNAIWMIRRWAELTANPNSSRD